MRIPVDEYIKVSCVVGRLSDALEVLEHPVGAVPGNRLLIEVQDGGCSSRVDSQFVDGRRIGSLSLCGLREKMPNGVESRSNRHRRRQRDRVAGIDPLNPFVKVRSFHGFEELVWPERFG